MYKIRVAIARLHRLTCTIYLTRLLNNHQDRVRCDFAFKVSTVYEVRVVGRTCRLLAATTEEER